MALCDQFFSSDLKQSFPRTSRLLKQNQFQAIFKLRPWVRTDHFVLYQRPTLENARFGIVLGKKFAQHAVTRNAIKRIAREFFRQHQLNYDGYDVLVRMQTRFPAKQFISAQSKFFKQQCYQEILQLFTLAQLKTKRIKN